MRSVRRRQVLILGLVLALGAGGPAADALAHVPRPSGLDAPREKQIAMELVSSAENSTLAWRREYGYIQVFRRLQLRELDRIYFDPAVRQAKADGLGTLGQFIYYDAIVMHGPGPGPDSFGGLRARALGLARTPAEGGSQIHYLNVFLDVRRGAMKRERDHHNTSRIDDEQRVFLREHNLALRPPLIWHTYGDRYEIR